MPWTTINGRQLEDSVARMEQRIADAFRNAKVDKAVQAAKSARSNWKCFLEKVDSAALRIDDPKNFMDPLWQHGVSIPDCYEVHHKPYTIVYVRDQDPKDKESGVAEPVLLFDDKSREEELNRAFAYYLNGIA